MLAKHGSRPAVKIQHLLRPIKAVKIQHILRQIKDDVGICYAGVYRILCECGKSYTGQTGRTVIKLQRTSKIH